jgi:hypothetical protein
MAGTHYVRSKKLNVLYKPFSVVTPKIATFLAFGHQPPSRSSLLLLAKNEISYFNKYQYVILSELAVSWIEKKK